MDPIIFVYDRGGWSHGDWSGPLIVHGRVIACFEEPCVALPAPWFNVRSSDGLAGSFLIRDEGVTWTRLDSVENRATLLAAYKLSESSGDAH